MGGQHRTGPTPRRPTLQLTSAPPPSIRTRQIQRPAAKSTLPAIEHAASPPRRPGTAPKNTGQVDYPRRKIEPDADALALPEQKLQPVGVALATSLASLDHAARWIEQHLRTGAVRDQRSAAPSGNAAAPRTVQPFRDAVPRRRTRSTRTTTPTRSRPGPPASWPSCTRKRANEVVIQVARGVRHRLRFRIWESSGWNDDGTVDVVVAGKTTTKLPDGKVIEDGNRWVVTATKEGVAG